jgi:hypothetical protein
MKNNYTLKDWQNGKFQLDTCVNEGIPWDVLDKKVQEEIREEQNRIAESLINNGVEERKIKFIEQYNSARESMKKEILKNELDELEFGLFGNQKKIVPIRILTEGKAMFEFGNRSVLASTDFFDQVHRYINNTYVRHLRNDCKFDFIQPERHSNRDSMELHPIVCGEILWRYRIWLREEHLNSQNEKPKGFFINGGHKIFELCWERHREDKGSFRFFSELFNLMQEDDYIFKSLSKADYLRHLKTLNNAWSSKKQLNHLAIKNRPQDIAKNRYLEVLKKLNKEKKP